MRRPRCSRTQRLELHQPRHRHHRRLPQRRLPSPAPRSVRSGPSAGCPARTVRAPIAMSKGPSALRLENDGEVVVSTHSPTGFGPIQLAEYLEMGFRRTRRPTNTCAWSEPVRASRFPIRRQISGRPRGLRSDQRFLSSTTASWRTSSASSRRPGGPASASRPERGLFSAPHLPQSEDANRGIGFGVSDVIVASISERRRTFGPAALGAGGPSLTAWACHLVRSGGVPRHEKGGVALHGCHHSEELA
jgi:hypothetical protein